MCESEKKEQTPNEQPKAFEEKDEFLEALNKVGDDGLKAAFNFLSKDGTTARIEADHLQRAVQARDPKISVQNAVEIIKLVNEEGSLNCDEFVKIIKMTLALKKAIGLQKAFDEIRQNESLIRVEDVRLAISILHPALSVEDVKKTIEEANIGVFNFEEFDQIFKVLEEPGEPNPTEKIVEKLNSDEHDKFVLYGEKGVGKTWTAREAAARAVRRGGFDAAIWVYLNRNYEQELSLQKSIAYQLSVLGDFEEFEAKEAKKKAEEEEAKRNEPERSEKPEGWEEVAKEEDKRKEEIEHLIKTAVDGKRLLFVLDGDGEKMMEAVINGKKKQKRDEGGEKSNEESKQEQVEKKVEEEVEKVFMELKSGGKTTAKLELGTLKSYKVLTTTSRKHETKPGENEILVKPFTWEDSKSLATQELKKEPIEANTNELEELARYFMFRSQRLPSQLLLISRIVAYFGGKGESGLQKLRNDRDTIKKGQGTTLFDVLIQGFEERLPKSVLIDCYSSERLNGHFMYQNRAVSFDELICYWIMEGHLGHSDSIDELYLKGHGVLMELTSCGLLQKQEANYVVPTGTLLFHFHIHEYEAFFREPRPGIGVTFDMSLGRVALGDERIRTIDRKSDDGKDRILSTLLLNGNRISDEERTAETLSKYKNRVEILAITDPTSQHFELPILEMTELRLLALRRCQFLHSLDPFLVKKPDRDTSHDKKIERDTDQSPVTISEKLEKLTVLEISGPCAVETIPDDFFSFMPNLKTINLSHLEKIKVLPPSFYELKHVEFLILRGCSSLKELSSLKKFKELKVLDVSEATLFEKFEDKSLHTNTKLQILNLSATNLKTLPLINQLMELKFVWMRDCKVLPRIRKIDKMRSLKIFDIAGALDVERFCDPSLEDLKSLLIVDISRTKIRRLPANIGNPTYLYARDCPKLKVVPPVEDVTKLEVLDLSGCHRLNELRKEFFDKLEDVIRELNLSKTRVKNLPFLSSLTSLQRLVLSECKFLEKVENLGRLEKMETLDLSGCEKMKKLEKVSSDSGGEKGTKQEKEASDSGGEKATKQEKEASDSGGEKATKQEKEASDSGGEKATKLEKESFDKMIHLKVLNLSRSGIEELPSLSKLQSLEELYVRDCPKLNELPGVEEALKLKVLDYSGTVLQSPPFRKQYESQDSSKTEQAHPQVTGEGIERISTTDLFTNLGFKKDVEDPEWKFKQEEVSPCKWIISNSRVENGEEKLGKPVYGAHFHKLMKESSSWAGNNFCFLVYPSEAEAEAKIKARFPNKNSYGDEVCLREIYLGQVRKEKMEKCLEIRGFNELPESLRPLLAKAQFVVLVEDKFLKSLLDLCVDSAMPTKACWIESCNELEYVVAAPEEVKKPEEEGMSEEEQRKKAAAAKGEGDKQKKATEEKAREEGGKGEGDQQKNSAVEKAGESAKSEGGDQPKNEDSEKGGGDEQKAREEGGKGEGDQQKNSAVEKAGESAKSEGDQPKNEDSEKGGGDEKKAGEEEKSADPAKKNEGDQSTGAAADNAGESGKGEGDQHKSAGAEEKTADAAMNEGGEKKEEKSEDPAKKNEGDQSTGAAADNAGESGKGEGDQPKSAGAEEKTADAARNEGGEKKEEKSGDNAKSGGDQPKNAAADDAKDSAKIEDNQEKNSTEQKPVDSERNEAAKVAGDGEKKNVAEDLNNLQTLWISDVSQMISICKGDITFKSLKSLYLEFCPNLTAISASSSQLPNLETLYIKYCQKLNSLFEDQNPSKIPNLKHLWLWGLDSLQKINCETPSLLNLRVGQCPLLKHLLSTRLTGKPDNFNENEGHDNLQTLHIKSCDKLKSIFEKQDGVVLDKLEELELSGLPKMQKVARSAQSLVTLRVEDCPSLGTVIDDGAGAPNLRILEVRSCERMKTVVEGGGSKLEEIKLLGLPELESVGPEVHIRKEVAKLSIWACPNLKDIPE